MGMRAQISLQFDDHDLYDNFVVPSKEQRTLNGVIVRCLSAYYYDEEIRNAIEGVVLSSEDASESGKSPEEIFADIRSSLMIQDYLASELAQTLDNGIEDAKTILNRTNSVMRDAGVVSESTSEYGGGVFKVNSETKRLVAKPESSDETGKSDASAGVLDIMVRVMKMLAKGQGNDEAVSMLDTILQSEQEVQQPVEEKTPSLEPQNEVVKDVISEPEKTEVFEEETDDFAPDVTSPVEDASSDMTDLLASLGL